MTGENEALPLSHEFGSAENGISTEQPDTKVFDQSADRPITAAKEEIGVEAASLREMRERHTRHLGQLIDRGHALALDMFEDASNRELEYPRRVQFARLADRVSETIRKLIVTFDRHTEERDDR